MREQKRIRTLARLAATSRALEAEYAELMRKRDETPMSQAFADKVFTRQSRLSRLVALCIEGAISEEVFLTRLTRNQYFTKAALRTFIFQNVAEARNRKEIEKYAATTELAE